MENRSTAVAATWNGETAESVPQIGEAWGVARPALKDLRAGRMPRVNLLVEGTDEGIEIVLVTLGLEHRGPVVTWQPGQPLELPLPGSATTLVLHDVSELTSHDQHRMLRWLDQAAGQIRVVSTTTMPLWPRVQTGAFNEVLYYRLNITSVDVGA